jgi:hypothetical protein
VEQVATLSLGLGLQLAFAYLLLQIYSLLLIGYMTKRDIKKKIASLKERRAKVLSTYDWRGTENTFELQYIKNIDKEIGQLSRWLARL